MKIGFYDSGLGGLSILKSFLDKFKTRYEYYYFGDSARAPYGPKQPEELISYMKEIFAVMQEKEVDLVISACNTSSALLHKLDLDEYIFPVISLTDVIRKYFKKSFEAAVMTDFHLPVGFMATQGSVRSNPYADLGMNLEPVVCSKLVPLVEAGEFDLAKAEWLNYLSMLSEHVEYVIVGCTHYSFLIDDSQRESFKFIDPADLCVDYFSSSIFADTLISYKQKNDRGKLSLELEFSQSDEEYLKSAEKLLCL